MLLAGCSKDADISNSTTLSGNGEKTPLLINATLDTGKGLTRAAGSSFAVDDELNVYFRHTIGNGPVYEFADAGLAQTLVPISVTSTGTSPSLSPIYWDDFSDNTNAATDLRTTDPQHALQSYYAYCYNGGTPNSITNNTGVLTWTVQTDQSEAEALQHSDLLWSQQQSPVSYNHDNSPNFPIPFTHAMSQITVELTANAGYNSSGTPLALTSLLLKNMDIKTTLTAPTGGWDATHLDEGGTHIHDVTMCKGDYTSGLTRTYTAIVAPGTILKEGVKLLDITGADDNNYEVIITNDMLWDNDGAGDDKGWSDREPVKEGDKYYITTQPGVNYHLALRIDKSAVQVSASLADWSDVTATGTGAIQFDPNVSEVGGTYNFASSSAFRLFWDKTPTDRSNSTYSYATTSTYSDGIWNNSPSLYWPNKNDSYYFRALAKVNSGDVTAATPELTTTDWSSTSIALTENYYILWGTSGGTAISPRTGGVPLEFRVVNKCKVKFTLATAASGDARVTLTGASISISNIYENGTINLEDGTVTGSATTTLEGTNPIAEQEVLAQIINENAVVTVTLAGDAGVYKINLNQCVESGGTTPIEVWKGGHTYNYIIHVEKEDVKFSAVVKPWTTVSGSGTASLNW